MIGLDQIVAVAIALLGSVVALAILAVKARGQVRVLSMVGTVLIFLGVLTRAAFQSLSERYLGELDNEVIVSILAADTLAGGVLTGIGLLLIARALVVAS